MFCPNCNKIIIPESHIENRTYNIRGDSNIEIKDHFYQCPLCSSEWSHENFDYAEECYNVYRTKYKMVQPKQLINFRLEYGLTQKDLANKLGWDKEDIEWIEKGNLQEDWQDKKLQNFITSFEFSLRNKEYLHITA